MSAMLQREMLLRERRMVERVVLCQRLLNPLVSRRICHGQILAGQFWEQRT